MKFLSSLKHRLQMKVYNAWLNIQNELDNKRISCLVDLMNIEGNRPYIDVSSSIIGAQFMIIGDACYFGKNSWVECVCEWKGINYVPMLCIGKRFSMQQNCHIGCLEKIEIGDNVLLGSKVYITDHYHGTITKDALVLPPIDRPLWSNPVKIGSNVWVGDNVSIMPGVTIGDNVIIGANAVVTHSFESNVVIAGVPAKVIRQLK